MCKTSLILNLFKEGKINEEEAKVLLQEEVRYVYYNYPTVTWNTPTTYNTPVYTWPSTYCTTTTGSTGFNTLNN